MAPEARLRSVARRRAAFTAATVLLDAAVLAFALFAGYVVSFPEAAPATFLERQGKLLAFVVALFPALFALRGGYAHNATGAFRRQASAALFAGVAGALVVFATLFLFRNTYYQRGALATFFLVLPSMLLAARTGWLAVRSRLLRGPAFRIPAAVHTAAGGEELAAALHRSPPSPILPVPPQARGTESPPCTVVAALSAAEAGLEGILAEARASGGMVRVVDAAVARTLAPVDGYDGSGVAVAGKMHRPGERLQSLASRLVDLAVAGPALFLSAPLFLALAVAVRLDSAGPVLFRQRRALAPGDRGFDLLKFRTMRNPSADGGMPEPPGRRGKRADDGRVTPVGRILRRLSLDELPQLLNVLRGEMSLVGPRPLPPAELEGDPPGTLPALLLARRGGVRAGVTGLWQIAGRSELGREEMLLLDAWYAEHRTALLDLRILLRTVPAVLSGKGAF